MFFHWLLWSRIFVGLVGSEGKDKNLTGKHESMKYMKKVFLNSYYFPVLNPFMYFFGFMFSC